ncbi:hypothetical protein MASR2M8_04260 [Opitutaceae bacterium]
MTRVRPSRYKLVLRHLRQFWIDHGKACRRIGTGMGRRLGSPTVTNIWIPEGSKDLPADRKDPRARLETSLDVGDHTSCLALLEELERLPFGAVWDEHYRRANVPVGTAWLPIVKDHEKTMPAKRD